MLKREKVYKWLEYEFNLDEIICVDQFDRGCLVFNMIKKLELFFIVEKLGEGRSGDMCKVSQKLKLNLRKILVNGIKFRLYGVEGLGVELVNWKIVLQSLFRIKYRDGDRVCVYG